MTILVATVSTDFVRPWWLPDAHGPRGTNTEILTCDLRLAVVWNLTETVEEKRLYWHDPDLSAWLWRWRANSFGKIESLTQKCVCVLFQLNSDQILRLLCLKGHVGVRDSTLWRRQMTRSEWILVYWNTLVFEGVQEQTKTPKNPGNALSDALLVSRLNFAASTGKIKRAPRGFLKPRFSFDSSIR